MSENTTTDAVKLAFDGNVSAFKDAVNDLLMDKIYDAVSMKKHEVAANYMEPDDVELETEEN